MSDINTIGGAASFLTEWIVIVSSPVRLDVKILVCHLIV
jgi:hypothetical protein